LSPRPPRSTPFPYTTLFRSLFEACRQAKAWQSEGLRPLRIAVNLAPSQFRLVNLVDQIRRALDAAALEPRFLEVELTESAVMSRSEEHTSELQSPYDLVCRL